MPRFVKTAYYINTLVYFDGVQLAAMLSDKGNWMLAVAINSKSDTTFIACEIVLDHFEEYLRSERCLLETIRLALNGDYYLVEISGPEVVVIPAKRAMKKIVEGDNWPKKGLFAKNNTENRKKCEMIRFAEYQIKKLKKLTKDVRWTTTKTRSRQNTTS